MSSLRQGSVVVAQMEEHEMPLRPTNDEKKTTFTTLTSYPSSPSSPTTTEQPQYSEKQYHRLLRKADRYLLPLMWFCYGVQQSDKTSLGTQAIFGLRDDIDGLRVGQKYSWLTTIFYLTYMVGEFPSGIMLQRFGLGRGLSAYMFCWGIVVTCIGAAQNWSQLMALRALQGFFECTISPGFVLVVGSWYRTEEHSSRSLFFQSANAGFGVIANMSMYGIGAHAQKYGGLAAWRCISLFLGGCTIVLSLLCFALLGSPKEVRWLTEEERKIAQARVIENKAGRDVTGIKWSWPQAREAFRDPQLWFSTINAFLASVPNGGLTTFAAIILNSLGFTELQVLLIEIPRSVTSVIVFIIVGIYTRKVANRRLIIMAAACIPAFVGLLIMAILPDGDSYKWAKWAGYYISVVYVLSLFLGWSLIPSNVAGRTKKTVISSATFVGYCVGNMCGSQIFKAKDGPRYIPGTIGSCACLGLEFLLICGWGWYYVWQNRRRDRAAAASGKDKDTQEREGREMGEMDCTDLENLHFRYSL